MKRAKVIGTAALLLVLAVSVPVRAQHGEQKRGQQHAQKAKPAGHGPTARASQQRARGARPAGRARQARPMRAAARGGRYHGRIPVARFRANFGNAHRFRMTRVEIIGGHRRFYYGGYWFVVAAPWPVGWAYGDYFYINYVNGGYYLFAPQYPGVQVAITLVL